MTIPAPLALIGGTSLLESDLFRRAERQRWSTPFGEVEWLRQGDLIFLQRHGLDHYTPPHRINHHVHLMALKEAGVARIAAVGSVGSLHLDIPPGTFLFPDDFYAPQVNPTFFDDVRGHRAPGFSLPWREEMMAAWRRAGLKGAIESGVYWQTTGPRFETPAEIRFHQSAAHVVGMTVASECILAGELGLDYAAVCMVDNFANGVAGEPLSFEGFKAQVRANGETIRHAIGSLLAVLQG
ncbi:MAG: MTAP family purine nucleoside phosphorylase [Magnetococcales bacterium]|nr:MTAP family purine nucleoside phosphorylase [Magnetococcales bacterium]